MTPGLGGVDVKVMAWLTFPTVVVWVASGAAR